MTRSYINDIEERYASDPASDVDIILHQNPKGRTLMLGVRGDFTVESRKKAANKVLSFPTGKEANMVLMSHVVMESLLPMSLVKRYGISTYSQKTPFFFDKKTDQFVVFMDTRFLRDINFSEIRPFLDDSPAPHSIREYYLSDSTPVLGVWFDSIAQIKQASSQARTDSPMPGLIDAYNQFKLSLESGSRMILVRYKDAVTTRSAFSNVLVNDPSNSSKASSVDLEIIQTVRFGNKYYVCDESGTIDPKTSFVLDKEAEQNLRKNTLENYYRDKAQGGRVLVLDYSDESWVFLVKMVARLSLLHKELGDFFGSGISLGKDVDSLDVLAGSGMLRLAHEVPLGE